jgi:LmbE family N-acetylglucosaminyl deacetylase
MCDDQGMPGTVVSFHAHPDDEAILVGGTLALAAEAGHRTVLVFATRGDLGEVAEGVLADDEALADRRELEARAAAAVLGVSRVEFLPYHDSGMAGEPTNDRPGAFTRADVDEAAGLLADVLREERATILTAYDDHGGYGHPDHVQVHHVGVRAAELAGTPRVYAATVSREYHRELAGRLRDATPEGIDAPDPDELDLGVPEALITTRIDVSAVLDRKRAAMAAHPSQIPDDSFFLAIDDEAFRLAFGLEWFIRLDDGDDVAESDLL